MGWLPQQKGDNPGLPPLSPLCPHRSYLLRSVRYTVSTGARAGGSAKFKQLRTPVKPIDRYCMGRGRGKDVGFFKDKELLRYDHNHF